MKALGLGYCREDLCRWLATRAPGITNLTLVGWFSGEDSHTASCSHRKFFDYHFGFIAGALLACNSALSLKLSGLTSSIPAPTPC